MDRKFPTFIACDATYAEAEIVIFGIPFDGTVTNRPGARFGPSAIRCGSAGIETYSPYSNRDLADLRCYDCGDIDLPFGNTKKVISLVREHSKRVLADDKIPVMLGGEHLITLGCVEAVYEKYPNVHIVHFDAHADLRDSYIDERLSHSTVIRRIWEIVGDGRIHQFGIRSGEKDEFEFAEKHTDMHRFDLIGFTDVMPVIMDKPVYFTLDLDVLDPSVLCGTGTPEAGGVTFRELLGAVLKLHQLDIVGADINELSPHYDHGGASTAAASIITREILLQIRTRRNDNG